MRLENKSRLRSGLGGLAAGSLLLFAQGGMAGTITVNVDDGGAVVDDANCSLREAIDAANNNEDRNGCVIDGAGPDDTIVFSGVTAIMLPGGEVTPELEINDQGGETQIDGGAGVTIDGNGDFIFRVLSETTMSSLTLQNADLGDNGAAIFATAPLTVQNSNINDSSASGLLDDGMTSASGGGIFTTADLTLMNTSMARNFAPRAGGAIEVDGRGGPITVSITGGTFDGNGTGVDAMGMDTAAPGNGGVLHITDPAGNVTTTITGATFTNNVAAAEGGALWNGAGSMTIRNVTVGGADGAGNSTLSGSGDAGDNTALGGGGVFNDGGTVEVEDSVISYNSAAGDVSSGGGLFNNEGGMMFISNTNVDFNTANRAGGGIESRASTTTRLDEGSTLSSNTANTTNTMAAAGGNGGGLHVTGNGNVDLEDVTVDSNVAAKEGGGLWPNTGTMNVFFSVVSNNESLGDTGGDTQGADGQGGGGIFLNAGDGAGGTLNINGSQITGNSAVTGSGSGGGIFVNQSGVMNVAASIIGGNTAARAGGGIESRAGSTVELVGVVLSGNNANGANGAPGNGGGMHVTGGDATTTVRASLVNDNVAAREGGGLWNFAGSVMNVNSTSLLRNMANGDAADDGGGALFENGGTMNVSFSRIIGNSATGAAGSGGGIFVNTDGVLNVDNSTIAANTSVRAGGGIENTGGSVVLERVNLGGTDPASGNIAGNNPGNGGGLHTTDDGTVDINESLVGYNTAAQGGGLWNFRSGQMVVTNTTVSNNQATGDGGGVYQQGGDGNGTTEVVFSTITQNAAEGDGGGVGAGNNMPMITVTSSIIAGNTSAGDAATNNVDLEAGVIADDDSNLIAANGGFDGNLRLYGPAVTGGWMGTALPTAVHPLLADAAAIDQASCDVTVGGVADTADFDQRRVERPQGADCDLGAFEFADIPALTVTNTSASAVTVTEDSEDVVVVAFTVRNDSTQAIDVNGFAGSINLNNLPANIDPSALQEFQFQAYIDDNGNGMLDEGDVPLGDPVSGLDLSTLRFQVNDPAADPLDAGESVSVIMVATNMPQVAWNPDIVEIVGTHPHNPGPALSWQTPAIAGGALLGLLSLVSVGRIRRRTRVFLLATSAALVLTACGGGGGGGGGGGVIPDNPMNPLVQGDIQFVVDTLVGGVDADLIGDGLPVNGPGITIQGLPETQDF